MSKRAKVTEITRSEYKALLDRGWKFRPACLNEFDNPDAEIVMADLGPGVGRRPYRILSKTS